MAGRYEMVNNKSTAYEDHFEHLEEVSKYFSILALVRYLENDREPGEIVDDKEEQKKHHAILSSSRRKCSRLLKRIEHRTRLTIEAGEVELPLESIQKRFELSDFEKNVLAVVICSRISTSFAEELVQLCNSRSVDIKTVLILLCTSLRESVSARKYFMPKGKLLSFGLIKIEHQRTRQTANEFLDLTIEPSSRIYSRIIGEDEENGELAPFLKLLELNVKLDDVVLPASIKKTAFQLVSKRSSYSEKWEEWGLNEIKPCGESTVLLFSGPEGSGRKLLARALAEETGAVCLHVNVNRMLGERYSSFDIVSSQIFNEARLRQAIVLLDEADALFDDRNSTEMFHFVNEIEDFNGVTIFIADSKYQLNEKFQNSLTREFEFPVPDTESREILWRQLIPANTPVSSDLDLGRIAKDFELTGGSIEKAIIEASLHVFDNPANESELTQDNLSSSATCQLGKIKENGRSDRRRIRFTSSRDADNSDTSELLDSCIPSVCMNDVVLPGKVMQQVQDIIAAANKKDTVFDEWGFGSRIKAGQSISAIFQGESGTGKTLTAEVIAGELNMKLSTVQTSSLISKWLGESEKNIASVFRKIDDKSVLFFDEADSIFTSRIDDGESHAEFVNRRISCLLKEIELFSGVILLATNFPGLIDTAFERRIRFKIQFPRPDATARETIWRRNVPDKAPLSDDVDFAELAEEYEFTGGQIRNVLLRAAFSAANREIPINQELLASASDEERPFTKNNSFGFIIRE